MPLMAVRCEPSISGIFLSVLANVLYRIPGTYSDIINIGLPFGRAWVGNYLAYATERVSRMTVIFT